MVTQSIESAPEAAKPTLFDRLGPDAGRLLQLRGWKILIFVVALLLTFPLSRRLGVPVPVRLLFALGAAFAIASALGWLIMVMGDGAGGALNLALAGSNSTPYLQQFSLEQAMVMRGEIDEALASFERRIAARGAGVDVRVRAAELYAREGKNPVRAAELLREARSLPEMTEGQDIYVTNRLVDLLAGPLNEQGRALVELRRLIERYPGTPAASHARAALSAIKWRAPREA